MIKIFETEEYEEEERNAKEEKEVDAVSIMPSETSKFRSLSRKRQSSKAIEEEPMEKETPEEIIAREAKESFEKAMLLIQSHERCRIGRKIAKQGVYIPL